MPRVSPEAKLADAVELDDDGILPDDKPLPPDYLSDDEKELWVQLVDRYPAHYFTVETQPLLEALCGHVLIMKKIMARVRDTPITRSEFKEWCRLFTEHTTAAGTLATKLRLTQLARISDKTATKLREKMVTAPRKSTKAWDVIRN